MTRQGFIEGSKCPKCAGRLVYAQDEHNEHEVYCIVCGWREVPTYTNAQRKDISDAMVRAKRIQGARRISAGRPLAGGLA